MTKNNNIIFIGFMGVGKGVVARKFADHHKKFCLDCDNLIESHKNLTIKKIFDTFGEDEFRNLERSLSSFLQSNVKDAVISSGGGFYAVNNLNEIGTVVYLKSDFDSIYKRLLSLPNSKEELDKRPLLADLSKAKELHDLRHQKYMQKADFVIDVTDKSLQSIIDELNDLLQTKKEEK